MTSEKLSLNGEWALEFTFNNETVKTSVNIPSNIEPVLQKLGLLGDYMPQDNEDATTAFTVVDDWTYSCEFEYKKSEGYEQNLVFEGIDTIAEIYINGALVQNCENMHLTYKIPLDGIAREGKNALKVVIRSSELWARRHPHDNFVFAHGPSSFYDSMTYLRKARYQWGWDNAPRLLTSGIFRSVYIEKLPRERFTDVYFTTVAVEEERVVLAAYWTYKTEELDLSSYRIEFALLDKGNTVATASAKVNYIQGRMILAIPKDEVKLWMPADFGEPYLYEAKVSALKNGETVAEYSHSFGIRSLDFKMSEDTKGGEGRFDFTVNGEKIFIKGTNWKPLDPLPSIADVKTREGRALECVKDLGCNMIRVWGGGIYEDEFFFDWCDLNGILVWQDFMLACEIPPLDGHYADLVALEAEHIIKKYRNHPSLAIWCGDNENDLSITWIPKPSTLRPSSFEISRKTLKNAVLRFDPMRSYVPSSPYLSDRVVDSMFDGDGEYSSIEAHLYPDPVDFHKVLRNTKSIFIGETGPINVNSISTAEWAATNDRKRAERLWDVKCDEGHPAHQNDAYFMQWRNTGASLCLDRYGRDFSVDEWDDYTVAVNLACAEIFKDVIEYCRVMPNKSGVLWWSLMDMWKMAFNYSVLDCDYNPKLAYHFIKKSQENLLLVATRAEIDGDMKLYFVNGTLKDVSGQYRIYSIDESMNEKTVCEGKFASLKNSVIDIATLGKCSEPKLLILEYTVNGVRYTNHAFTDFRAFDTMKSWLRIMSSKLGFKGIREKL